MFFNNFFMNNQIVKIEENHVQGPFIIKNNLLAPPTTYSKTGHWSDKENIKYYAFLKKYRDKFEEKQSRRQWKVFKTLAQFIKTRNPNQCRSHHHKMRKGFPTISQTLYSLRIKIPQIEKKAKKYEDSLSKLNFYASNPQNEQKNPQYEPVEKDKQFQLQISQEKAKKSAIQQQRTGLTYELQEQPQWYQMVPTYGQKQLQMMECHEYFLRWWNKLSSLMMWQQLYRNQ